MVLSKRVPIDILRPGVTLCSPIADPQKPRIRLLGAGVVMTEDFIKAIKRRGVSTVILSENDIAVLRSFTSPGRRTSVPPGYEYPKSSVINDYSESFDENIQAQPAVPLTPSGHPVSETIQMPADCSYEDGLQNEWAHKNNDHVDLLSGFFDDTSVGQAPDVGPLYETVNRIMQQISEDMDALVCMSSTPYEANYPSRHSIHLTGIAMAIGVGMGLGETQLIDLGIGCLIHDAGMQSIGLRIFDNQKPLSSLQLHRLSDHPVKSLEVACKFGDAVSKTAKIVAYQMHERNDGSGYPRGWTAENIHPLAKIAAVADAYVGMLTNRKHRLAIQGYHVMAHLLAEMKAGKFDSKVMRSLLHVASLYPLGSFVKLNNQCVGRVIRSGREQFVEPTIEMWHRDYRDREPAIVNLKNERSIRITGSTTADKSYSRHVA